MEPGDKWTKNILDPEIVEMVRFLDPETAEILQFLDPEIVRIVKMWPSNIYDLKNFLNEMNKADFGCSLKNAEKLTPQILA